MASAHGLDEPTQHRIVSVGLSETVCGDPGDPTELVLTLSLVAITWSGVLPEREVTLQLSRCDLASRRRSGSRRLLEAGRSEQRRPARHAVDGAPPWARHAAAITGRRPAGRG